MESSAAFSTETREAAGAVAESAAALNALVGAVSSGLPDGGSGPLSGAHPQPEGGVPVGADPLRERADACLDGFAELARLEARSAALRARITAEYLDVTKALAAPELPSSAQEMAEVAEVACAMTVSERTAGALISDCVALTERLPLTLKALQAGTLSWQHARIMVDETANLDAAEAAALEAHFLDPSAPDPARGCPAGELVPGRFRAKARTWRERHHPVSIETRHKKCAADRRVEFVPDRDGMAWFNTYLPADTASALWARTTADARALQRPEEPRTLAQLRADVAATLLLTGDIPGLTPAEGTGTGGGIAYGDGRDSDGGTGIGGSRDNSAGSAVAGGVPVPRAQVLVTVPVFSLLGVTEEPAMLGGYGPIPPSMARRLVAGGADSFHRVLVDPRDGAPLEIGRTSYRVTKALRQWLGLRDGKCSFPSCNNHSLDNEADHLLAWADGGTTGISNLGQPCRKHHRLKHTTAWRPAGATRTSPPGWTSPTGRTYPSEQQDWEPPQWPENIPLPEKIPESGAPVNEGWAADPGTDWEQFAARFPGCDPGDLIEPGLPPGPGWGADMEPPPDPFADSFQFTADHESEPETDPQDPGWDPGMEPPMDPFPDWYQFTAA
ncbi:HNH endonuclease signature motif containing protein [Arthrobacter sp. EPSL27]|uniref:HNH endonuclease signature motif containing protein n=1 Tax=Arthrobacter sp. EPSL27 TaxID=1745378 RepID=UPI0009E7F49C|nr:HNH endonuclease signature motif containing protein [Arthrobacter sp. EPSL27]